MSFDRLASIYAVLENLSFGARLQDCRTAGLSWIEPPRRTLLLGEGDGRFLLEILQRFPDTRIHVIDASPAMLSRARNRVEKQLPDALDRIVFEEARMPHHPLDAAAYDLLVTHFFLDCFDREGLERLLPYLAPCLTTDAQWLLADFRLPEQGWYRLRARLWLGLMYRFFALTTDLEARTLQDPRPILKSLGWRCDRYLLSDRDFLQASLWRREIRGREDGECPKR